MMVYTEDGLLGELRVLLRPAVNRFDHFMGSKFIESRATEDALRAWARTLTAPRVHRPQYEALPLVEFAFGSQEPPLSFWGTNLGRYLFTRGGTNWHPTKMEAATLLGVSRQRVVQLVASGALEATGNGNGRVTRESVIRRVLGGEA